MAVIPSVPSTPTPSIRPPNPFGHSHRAIFVLRRVPWPGPTDGQLNSGDRRNNPLNTIHQNIYVLRGNRLVSHSVPISDSTRIEFGLADDGG